DREKLASVPGLKNLTAIPIGSNIAPLSNAAAAAAFRQQAGLGSFQTILGYFGLINESKGVEELIQALLLVRNTGVNAGLLIIGGGVGASDATNAAYLEKIKALIARNALTPYVKWTGHLVPEQVSAALQCVDIAVLPFQDGVSLRRGSLMAAISHGLPIISTLPPNPIPDITQGETMVLVSAKDVQSLAGAIINVMNDSSLRMRLARHAIDLASRFTWPVITRQTLEALYAALAG
ncbi:MAG: glycosyltransferase, partial [Anaerolineae bacterium]